MQDAARLGVDAKLFMGTFERLASQQPRMETPVQQADEVWLNVKDWKPSLSEKVVHIIQWAYDHGYDYVFKADLDTYIRVDRLLRSGFENSEYLGWPVRPDGYGGLWRGRITYYAQGGAGFWLSRKAMKAFLEADQSHIPFSDAEDVRMGWLMAEQGIELTGDERYEPYRCPVVIPEPENEVITTHKCSAEHMRAIHKKFVA